jgi:hypothetical protein
MLIGSPFLKKGRSVESESFHDVPPTSFSLDIGCSDDRPPLLDLRPLQQAERFGCLLA